MIILTIYILRSAPILVYILIISKESVMFAWDVCCLTQLFNIPHIDGCQNYRILIPPHKINEDSPSTLTYVEASPAITIGECIGAIKATRCWCLWFIVASWVSKLCHRVDNRHPMGTNILGVLLVSPGGSVVLVCGDASSSDEISFSSPFSSADVDSPKKKSKSTPKSTSQPPSPLVLSSSHSSNSPKNEAISSSHSPSLSSSSSSSLLSSCRFFAFDPLQGDGSSSLSSSSLHIIFHSV